MTPRDAALFDLFRAIVVDPRSAARSWDAAPALVSATLEGGATRTSSKPWFFDEILHYVYAGDTALHVAAAAYRDALVVPLMESGANVRARNRRGAEPLHYAADGGPGAPHWDPRAQAATIASLLACGADPNAVDNSGVAPLHRAVRGRCAAAVRALLDGGADARKKNKSGSTPLALAQRPTGRGGAGSPAAKAQQAEIITLLSARA